MAAQKSTGARKGAGRQAPKLPPVTVAKLEETGRLLERVISENQSLFISKGQAYKDAHREGSRRPLTPQESAQVAAMIAEEAGHRVEVAEQVQQSTLSAYDEPDTREILLAAGIGAAPKFIEAVRDVVALIEMPSAAFEAACDDDSLDQAVQERSQALRKLDLKEARQRASDAFAHYAQAAGFDPGEVARLPVQAVWQALTGAVTSLVDASQSTQLIDSAASTEGSPEPTSSTASAGPTP